MGNSKQLYASLRNIVKPREALICARIRKQEVCTPATLSVYVFEKLDLGMSVAHIFRFQRGFEVFLSRFCVELVYYSICQHLYKLTELV